MLVETYFSEADASYLEQMYQKSKKMLKIIIPAMIAIDIIIALLVYKQLGDFFIPFLVLLLLLGFYVIKFVLMKHLDNLKRDLSEGVKLKVKAVVKKKEVYKDTYSVEFDTPDVKSISITKAAYSEIQVGDVLELETTKYAGKLLRMEKGGVELPR